MLLECSVCYSKFDVQPDVLGSQGRKVRCGVCKHVWFQTPTSDTLYEEIPELLPLEDSLGNHRHSRSKKPTQPMKKKSSLFRWGILLLFLSALLTFVIVARVDIIHFWPATAKFYKLIGKPRLPIDQALQRRNFEIAMDTQQGFTVPRLKGRIVNVSQDPRVVPYVKLAFYNDETCRQEGCLLDTMLINITPGHKAFELKGKEAHTFDQPLPQALPKNTRAIEALFDLTPVY